MIGFEYCAATGMIYEGMEDEALTCIRAVRERFDGAKRNPFSEAECGHHYARAMAGWSAMIAWSGFRYSGVDKVMCFTSRPGRYFWSNGSSWGICEVSDKHVSLKLLKGCLELKKIKVGDREKKLKDWKLECGEERTVRL